MCSASEKDMKEKVWAEIDRHAAELKELARNIHRNPEINFEEFQARDWLCTLLDTAGFRIEKGLSGLETAFRAELSGTGPRVAFLAEYDALPGLGHACGHNLIGPASVGAALGIAGTLEELPGTLYVIGTPAEEGGGGKVTLAKSGVFQGLDAAMMTHPSNANILWKKSLARRKLQVEFFGRSVHASAYPDKGINALDAVIQTFNTLNALRQQMEDTSRIHGIITQGGDSPNVIPDYTSAVFYVRALEDAACDELLERVQNCCRAAATATGCSVKMHMTESYQALKINMPLARAFEANSRALGIGFANIDPRSRLGSTDMGDVSHCVPVIQPYIQIASPGQELFNHTVEFREAACSERGMQAMIGAAKALAATALDVMRDPSLLEEMQRSFLEEEHEESKSYC